MSSLKESDVRRKVKVTAYPRVHISLLDTAQRSAFSPGGVGFSVSSFPLVLTASWAGERRLNGFDGLDEGAHQEVNALLSRLSTIVPRDVEISLLSVPPQHVGLGSKTLLLNSIVAAVLGLAGNALDTSRRKVLTGRGGTSGVGLHAFYTGGLIWDAGHRTPPVRTGLKPSSFSAPVSPPILMGRWPLDGWAVALLIPEGRRYSGKSERQIFHDYAEYAPDEEGLVWTSIFNGVLPALLTGNQSALASSLRGVHSVGFKASELSAQADQVKRLYKTLASEGMACGLSSMGPLLYVLEREEGARQLASFLSRLGVELEMCSIVNHGYSMELLNA